MFVLHIYPQYSDDGPAVMSGVELHSGMGRKPVMAVRGVKRLNRSRGPGGTGVTFWRVFYQLWNLTEVLRPCNLRPPLGSGSSKASFTWVRAPTPVPASPGVA